VKALSFPGAGMEGMTKYVLVALVATASLVACGGEEPAASGGADAANKKALLQYAQCMRDHGVDMPDPQFSGGRVTMRTGGQDTSREKLEAAQSACQKFQEQVKSPAASAGEKEDFKKRALANAQCMRDHGIANFPDPQFEASGAARITLGEGSGIDPQSPKFQAAQKACGEANGGPSLTSVGEDK